MHLKLSTYAEGQHDDQVDKEVDPCQVRYNRYLIKIVRFDSKDERGYHKREVKQHRTRDCLRALEYIFKFHLFNYKFTNACPYYMLILLLRI